jgi:CheY-like chemotaxis protein
MIVCVDDDVELLDCIVKGLQRHNKMSIGFHKPIEALEYLTNSKDTEVVIIDFNMPVMNGVELATAIRQFSEVPIIFHSGTFDKSMGKVCNSLIRSKSCTILDLVDDVDYSLSIWKKVSK